MFANKEVLVCIFSYLRGVPYCSLPCYQLCQPLDNDSIQAALQCLSISILERNGLLGLAEPHFTIFSLTIQRLWQYQTSSLRSLLTRHEWPNCSCPAMLLNPRRGFLSRFCGEYIGTQVRYGTGLIAVERANGVSEGLVQGDLARGL